jgi:hypothetical protein
MVDLGHDGNLMFEVFNDSHTKDEVLAVVDRAIAISRGEAYSAAC